MVFGLVAGLLFVFQPGVTRCQPFLKSATLKSSPLRENVVLYKHLETVTQADLNLLYV